MIETGPTSGRVPVTPIKGKGTNEWQNSKCDKKCPSERCSVRRRVLLRRSNPILASTLSDTDPHAIAKNK